MTAGRAQISTRPTGSPRTLRMVQTHHSMTPCSSATSPRPKPARARACPVGTAVSMHRKKGELNTRSGGG